MEWGLDQAVLCQAEKLSSENSFRQADTQVMRPFGNQRITKNGLMRQVMLFCAEIGLLCHVLLRQSVITSAECLSRLSDATVNNKTHTMKKAA